MIEPPTSKEDTKVTSNRFEPATLRPSLLSAFLSVHISKQTEATSIQQTYHVFMCTELLATADTLKPELFFLVIRVICVQEQKLREYFYSVSVTFQEVSHFDKSFNKIFQSLKFHVPS